jgi:hypothetical protein
MFGIPENPYKHHPERKSTVRVRVGVVVGSVATAAVSVYEMYQLPPLDVVRSYLHFTTLASLAVASLPIIAELQERFRTDGGGGGGWYVPDFPIDPDPGGLRIDIQKNNDILV